MSEIWSYRAAVVTEPTVAGYRLVATDGSVGRVEQAVDRDQRSCLLVETDAENRRVLLPAGLVESVDHDRALVHVSLSGAEIEDAPAFEERVEPGEAYLQPFGDEYWGAYGNTAE